MNSVVYDAMFNDFQLNSKQIDIWEFPLAPFFTEAYPLLNREEQARAARFYFPIHQQRFTMARALMRIILGHYLNKPPHTLNFSYKTQGKPFLELANNIEFNLSHSDNLALLAIGKTYPLGVDLEFFSARPYAGIAKQLFSEQELWAFNKVSNYVKPLSFFHIWSQKEAFIKASGLGLAFPTKQFNVSVLHSSNNLIFDSIHKKNWKLHSFMPKIACCASLCYEPPVESIRYIKITNAYELFNV